MRVPSLEQIEDLRERYAGQRIKLLDMPDDRAPVPPGTEGLCVGVDGIGNLLMQWDNGSRLSLVLEVDRFTIVA